MTLGHETGTPPLAEQPCCCMCCSQGNTTISTKRGHAALSGCSLPAVEMAPPADHCCQRRGAWKGQCMHISSHPCKLSCTAGTGHASSGAEGPWLTACGDAGSAWPAPDAAASGAGSLAMHTRQPVAGCTGICGELSAAVRCGSAHGATTGSKPGQQTGEHCDEQTRAGDRCDSPSQQVRCWQVSP